MTGSATITTIRFPVLLILPGNKLPACQGRRQAFGVLFTASDTEGLWEVGQDTHALLLVPHRSRRGVRSTCLCLQLLGGLWETTGVMDLEPGVPGGILVYTCNSSFISWGGHFSPKIQCSAWATRWQPGAAGARLKRAAC